MITSIPKEKLINYVQRAIDRYDDEDYVDENNAGEFSVYDENGKLFTSKEYSEIVNILCTKDFDISVDRKTLYDEDIPSNLFTHKEFEEEAEEMNYVFHDVITVTKKNDPSFEPVVLDYYWYNKYYMTGYIWKRGEEQDSFYVDITEEPIMILKFCIGNDKEKHPYADDLRNFYRAYSDIFSVFKEPKDINDGHRTQN